jgi:hypothetical protein
VAALCGVWIFMPDPPALLAGGPEPPSLAAQLAGNVHFWITLDLVLASGFLVWALIFRRSWRIVPYFLYWILVVLTGVLSYGLLESNSFAALLPLFGTLYLGAPWNFLLFVPGLEPLWRTANDLPGKGAVLLWIGILINQGLLARIVLKRPAPAIR